MFADNESQQPSFHLILGLPPQNLQFIGRKAELQQLSEMLNPSEDRQRRVAVLHGLGGVGKTNIALHYAWQNYTAYSFMIWVDAATQATINRSFISVAEHLIEHMATTLTSGQLDYVKIASNLGISGLINTSGQLLYDAESDQQQRIIKAVVSWLALDGNDQWLLVFDNLDDVDLLDKQRYFPSSPMGHIIVTSRRQESYHLGTGSIQVDMLEPNDALKLLLKRCNKDSSKLNETGDFMNFMD